MNRTLKFKVLERMDDDTYQCLFPNPNDNTYSYKGETCSIAFFIENQDRLHPNIIISQFTGRTDVNDMDIYEGDTLRRITESYSYRYVCTYSPKEAAYILVDQDNADHEFIYLADFTSCEVVASQIGSSMLSSHSPFRTCDQCMNPLVCGDLGRCMNSPEQCKIDHIITVP